MNKCKENKIVNPKTNYCIDIDGPIAKKLIEGVKKQTIKLRNIDLQLLLSKGLIDKKDITAATTLTTIIAPKKIINTNDHPQKNKTPVVLSDKIKNKLLNLVEKQRTRMNIQYVDENHKQFCASKQNYSLLSEPIVHKTIGNIFPVYTNKQNFVQLMNSGTGFTSTFINGMNFSLNNYNKSIALNLYNAESESVIDTTWFKQVNEYIKSLSAQDILTLIGYTFHGDVWANSYMRGTFDQSKFMNGVNHLYDYWISSYMPLFFQALHVIESTKDLNSLIHNSKHVYFVEKQMGNISMESVLLKKDITVLEVLEIIRDKKHSIVNSSKYLAMGQIAGYFTVDFWLKCIELYCADLNRIIRKAPALKTKMIVFRGVKDDYYLKGSKKSLYTNQGFISTSIYYKKASNFAAYVGPKNHTCCLKRITLLPGTRCIFLSGLSKFPDEFEILLPSDSIYHLRNAKATYKIYKDEYYKTTDICAVDNSKLKYVQVTDIVLLK